MTEIRWGIVGCGAVASLFAEGLQFVPGARLEAVASRSQANADVFAARFGARRALAGYERLVTDQGLDVVYVATPNALHREHCLMAIEAGKAVLCEKPFALDAAEGLAVMAAARRRGVFCMEGMWMRFSPAFREVLKKARTGALGELRLLSAGLGFPHLPDPTSRLFGVPGGGALLDLGVYPLSLAQALLGRPRRIQSAAILGTTSVDEQVTAVLDYKGGAQAVFTASLCAQLANAASIHGTTGMLRLEAPLYFPHRYSFAATPPARAMRQGERGALARLRLHPWARALAERRGRSASTVVVRRASGNGYDSEAAEVMRCLRAGLAESPEMPLDDTLAVLETMDAVRAHWTKVG